jgi:hypothetical protein
MTRQPTLRTDRLLLRPFLRIASSNEALREVVPSEFWSVKDDARVALSSVHGMLCRGIEHQRDDLLGLKLGGLMCFGAGGPFDYAVRSAPTVRKSIAVASEYSKLLCDTFHVTLETFHDRAVVRLDDEPGSPRAAGDFAVHAVYRIHLSDHLPSSSLECWFPYAAPRDTSTYERAFPGVALRFGAPSYGFAFSRSQLDASSRIHCSRNSNSQRFSRP